MPDLKAERPSEEVMWAGPSGERWLANADRFEETIRPIGDALLDRAALAPGEHVLDVGCGAGSMSFDIAQRVAPNGSVTGLDISPALVGEGTRRTGVVKAPASVRFVLADAARADLPKGAADVLVSRFGCMFFTDPYAAFTHMRGFLRSGGRMALATWAPLKQNPWMLEMRTILLRHFDLPVPPPRIPGPYAFDEPDYVRDILTKAGFTQIEFSPWQTDMHVGGKNSDPESSADFLLHALSMAQRALDAPPEKLAQVRSELTARLRDFLTPTGVRMLGSVWLITARA